MTRDTLRRFPRNSNQFPIHGQRLFLRAVHPQDTFTRPYYCLWYLKSYVVKQGSAAAAMPARQRDPLLLRTEYNASAPAGAIPEGVQRALYLCDMKIQPSKTGNKSDPEGNDPCLENLLKVDKQSPHHELYKRRRIPKHGRLRNKEFLLTLGLESEGHLTAIPPAWQVPHDELP